jgi:hypothetical protein
MHSAALLIFPRGNDATKLHVLPWERNIMRQFIFLSLTLSTAIIAAPHPAAAQSKEWCTIESSSTRECYWDTWDQCRQGKTHLEGGSCFRNPAFAGRPSADPGFRPVRNISAPSPLPYAAVPVQGTPYRSITRRKHRHTAER